MTQQTKVIETEQLLLRQFTLADLDDYFAFYQKTRVEQQLSNTSPSYVETGAELVTIMENYGRYGFGLWATIEKGSGAFIGRCGLSPRTIAGREEVEVAYALAPTFRGRGLAVEAARAIIQYGLEHLHLPRLICLVMPQNQADVQTAQKTGMLFSGERFLDGLTFLCYSISQPEEI